MLHALSFTRHWLASTCNINNKQTEENLHVDTQMPFIYKETLTTNKSYMCMDYDYK